MKPLVHTRPSGFTLMEMVITILVLAIGSACVILLYGGLYSRNSTIENTQEGALLVQSCVENLVGMRQQQQSSFFSTSLATLQTSCDYLPNLHNSSSGTTLSVTASAPTSATPPCPASPVACIKFVIYAKNNTTQTSPSTTLFLTTH